MTDSAQPFAELQMLERLIESGGRRIEVRSTSVGAPGARLPLHALMLGNADARVPAFVCVAGIHGLERIGTLVVLEFLRSLLARLDWDPVLHHLLERLRLVFVPLANPAGMLMGRRANAHGVDLMRNAPIDAIDRVPWLVGGQRWSRHLPWYRGRAAAPMQEESAFLADVVCSEAMGRPYTFALDWHSGFGMRDRLWFPWASRRTPMPHLPQLHAWVRLFEQGHAHHPYVIEPQSAQYLAHGDLWDWLYLQACERHAQGVFLACTVEMGSWLWVRKNPRQLLSLAGIFNPLVAHREARVLRRHLPLFDFALRSTAAASSWLPHDALEREQHLRAGRMRWYS